MIRMISDVICYARVHGIDVGDERIKSMGAGSRARSSTRLRRYAGSFQQLEYWRSRYKPRNRPERIPIDSKNQKRGVRSESAATGRIIECLKGVSVLMPAGALVMNN